MVSFCPFCANLLFAEQSVSGRIQFTCKLCPVFFPVTKTIKSLTYCKPKMIDDVLGGEDAWKNVDSTEERCPECGHNRAYFQQLQTRSADEPMTTFYRCCNNECKNNWRD